MTKVLARTPDQDQRLRNGKVKPVAQSYLVHGIWVTQEQETKINEMKLRGKSTKFSMNWYHIK